MLRASVLASLRPAHPHAASSWLVSAVRRTHQRGINSSGGPSSLVGLYKHDAASVGQLPFLSARTASSLTASPSTLDIKLPEALAPEEDNSVQIPFVPDFWESSAVKEAEKSLLEEPSEGPKIITTASPATHPAGGPHHNLYQLSEPISEETAPSESQKDSGIISDMLEDVGLPSSFANATSRPNVVEERIYSRPLDVSEKQGVYVFLGILLGSWIVGGLAAPASPKKNGKKH